MPARITVKQIEPDITVLEFAGRITMGLDCRNMEETILELLSSGKKKVIFDLSAVEYVDSSGIGSIAYSFAKIIRADGGLRLAGLSDRLMPLFRMTRLDTVFTFFPTVAAAAAAPW